MKMCVFENVRSGRRPNFCVRCTDVSPNPNKICDTSANFLSKLCAEAYAKCNADSAASCADVVRVAQRISARRPSFCVRGKPKSNKICETFARFLAEFLLAFERRNRAISMPNAAVTRPGAALTSCILNSARSARSARSAHRPSFACAVHQNQTKFAKRSRVFARNFARFRTPKSRKVNAKCSADSDASCSDVVRVQ